MGEHCPIIDIRTAPPRRVNCFPATSAARPSVRAAPSRSMCASIRESDHMAATIAGKHSQMAERCASTNAFTPARSPTRAPCVHVPSTSASCCASTYAPTTRVWMLCEGHITAPSARPICPRPMSSYSISSSTATRTPPSSDSQS